MVGIRSFGSYVPKLRLSRKEIGDAWGIPSAPGEKAVASWDEDSLTMAVEAGLDCLRDFDSSLVDGLYFASTTAPYKEKQTSSVIAAALDLRRDIQTADFTDSLRAGTTGLRAACDAVKSGSAKNVLVVASDCRLGEPQTAMEQLFGDGAVALLVSDEDVAAGIDAVHSITDEFTGPWRKQDDTYVRQFEAKLDATYGYARNVAESASGLLKRERVEPKSVTKLILYAPDPKSFMGVAKRLGFEMNQLQDPLLLMVGNTGTPQCLMILVAALEQAKPGDRLLVVSYGDGSDALLMTVTDRVDALRDGKGVTPYIESKAMLPSYAQYTKFRNIVSGERAPIRSSTVTYWRDRKQELNLYGARCKQCGVLQYPIGRVCFECGAKDEMEEVKLAKSGKVFTFTLDNLAIGMPLPVPRLVVDLNGGGRIFLEMTDCEPEKIEVGMPVELTFRRMHEGAGFYNYYWKARPPRKKEA